MLLPRMFAGSATLQMWLMRITPRSPLTLSIKQIEGEIIFKKTPNKNSLRRFCLAIIIMKKYLKLK
jgi:hypothetical protein